MFVKRDVTSVEEKTDLDDMLFKGYNIENSLRIVLGVTLPDLK